MDTYTHTQLCVERKKERERENLGVQSKSKHEINLCSKYTYYVWTEANLCSVLVISFMKQSCMAC